MHDEKRKSAVGYAMAVLAVVGAALARLLLDPFLGDHLPFVTFFVAVVIASWYDGWRPGLLATVLGLFSAWFFFVPPRYVFFGASGPHLVGLGMYLMVSLAIAGFGGLMRNAQRRSLQAQQVAHEQRQRAAAFSDDLRKRAEELDALLRVLPVGIFVANDPNCTHISMNPAGAEMLGIEPDVNAFKTGPEADKLPFRVLKDGVELRNEELPMQRAARTGTMVRGEVLEVERDDGSTRSLYEYAVPLFDQGGQLRGCLGVFVDITDRKRAEAALHRNEQELSDFFENASVGLHWVGSDGTILRANQAELDLLGYAREEYVGHHIGEFHADQPVIEDILRRLQSGQTLRDYPARLRCKDESVKEVLIDSSVLWEDGRFVHTRCFTRDITEQKRAEKALACQKQALEMVARRVPLSEVLAFLMKTIEEQSPAGMLGAIHLLDEEATHFRQAVAPSLPELYCRSTGVAVHSDKGPCCRAVVTRQSVAIVDLARESQWSEFADLAKSLGLRSCWSTPIISSDNRVLGTFANYYRVPRDPNPQDCRLVEVVTRTAALAIEHVRVEEALRQSEERYRSLTEAITSVVWTTDAEGRFVVTQPSWAEFTGQTWEELRNFGWVDALHPDDREYVLSLWRTACVAKQPYKSDGRLWHASSGSYRHFEARGVPILNDDGTVREWVGKCLDVEDRKQAEMVARVQGERLRLLWAAAAVLLSTDDPDVMMRGLFAKVSQHLAVDAYFNFMVSDTGDSLRLASCMGIPDDKVGSIKRLEFGEAICGTVALHRQPIIAAHIQQSNDPKVQMVRGFGIRAYACNPLLAENRLIGTLSFASRTKDQFDNDEVAFLETLCHYVTMAYERLRLVERLREADRRKDEFLATLAHELRNPLAPVWTSLQLLSRANGNTELVEHARTVMERQVSQMVRLIDDLLDVARITRGKLELRRERVELAAVVKNAVEASRPLIELMEHDLAVSLPAIAVYLEADSVRLTQVFLNLLNNAAKYTERGGRIRLIAEREGNEIVVSIKDNGVGIPADKLRHVFEMFTQVAGSLERSQGGLGLGLTLVKRLTEMHGGSVEARSGGLGKGSEFRVRLPVAEIPTWSESSPPNIGTSGAPKLRILVVDDNRDGADSLAMMLRLLGNKVQTAYDGIEAVQTAEGFQPDVVLLDIGLPKLNGYDACRLIRQESWGKEIVIIAVTGWGQEDDRRRSREVGFNFHMVKPVNPADLERLLAGLSTTPA